MLYRPSIITRRGLITGAAALAMMPRDAHAAATTLNPSDKGSSITLRAGNLGATTSSGSWENVRSTTSKTSGKWYIEYLGNMYGFATSAASLTTYIGAGTTSFGITSGGALYFSPIDNQGGHPSYSEKRGCMCIDFTVGMAWSRSMNNVTTNAWKGSGGADGDPEAGTGGINISSITGSALYAIAGVIGTNDRPSMGFGARPFFGAVPSGFSGIDEGYPATYTAGLTELNASDKDSNITLSQDNLRAAINASVGTTQKLVRCTKTLPVGTAGLFEVAVTGSNGNGNPVNVGDPYAIGMWDTTTSLSGPSSAAVLQPTGAVIINGTTVATVSALAFAVPDIISVYANLKSGVKKIWFAKNGTWDGDPSAGTGGYDISAVTPSLDLRAGVAMSGDTMDAADFNFGSMTLAGAAVPTGGQTYDDAVASASGGARSRGIIIQ